LIGVGDGTGEPTHIFLFHSLFQFPFLDFDSVEVHRGEKKRIASIGATQTCTWVENFGRKKETN
jgi:hypothetical protein